MADITIPPVLIESIRSQQAILFLGAGASMDMQRPTNPPSGNKLRDLICDKFLNGKLKERTLAEIADIAASESSMHDVEDFIHETFEPFQPSDFHLLIPTFRWHAIVTTNYDLIIERAYAQAHQRYQELVPFLKDGQRIEKELQKHTHGLQYIKLHGCINHVHDNEAPIILSTEQYMKYGDNRKRLYGRFRDMATEMPVIFCGHRIADLHIKEVLFDLADPKIRRPRYYYIAPDITEYDERYWSKNNVTTIKCGFQDFVSKINDLIPKHQRQLVVPQSDIQRTTIFFKSKVANALETELLHQFLEVDVEHVRPNMPVAYQDPKEFYKGYDSGWGSIAQNLDIYRGIADNVLMDAVLADEKERGGDVELFLLKGPAGNGKTISLKRIAWEAANSYSKLVLFHKDGGALRREAIEEIFLLTQERIFLMIDRVALVATEVNELIISCIKKKIKITIVVAERDSEWNTKCERLDQFLSGDFSVRFLSQKEAEQLIQLLEKHDSLGLLKHLTPAERMDALLVKAERQLLVALHEATLGRPFEDIVYDEYKNIDPLDAQGLYLDVCSLNRWGVKVRAGLISRMSGITFTDFKERFFKPLEHIVLAGIESYSGDHTYAARHQHVAEILFNRALPTESDKYDHMLTIISAINPDYSSDNEAFAQLIKSHNVAHTFSSQELGRAFYKHVEEVHGVSPHLYQQMSLFALNPEGGDLEHAERYVIQAAELAPHNPTILHTKALIEQERANRSEDPLLKIKHRKKAREALGEMKGKLKTAADSYHAYTMIGLALDDIQDLANKIEIEKGEDKALERLLNDSVKNAQIHLGEALQNFSNNPKIVALEARLFDILDQQDKAVAALKKAFELNKRQDWLAIRLAKRVARKGQAQEAIKILKDGLEVNPGSKHAHFELAQLYMNEKMSDDLVLDHFRKSFSDGDSNFDAQFWYARQLFVVGRYEDAYRYFNALKEQRLSPNQRTIERGIITDNKNVNRLYSGKVVRREDAYAFLRVDVVQQDIFCPWKNIMNDEYDDVKVNTELEFNIGFTMRGPVAVNVRMQRSQTQRQAS